MRRYKSALLCLLITVFLVNGCGKVTKEFDFSNVTDVKVVNGTSSKEVVIRDSKRAQEIVKDIARTKWVRDDNSKNIANDRGNWAYRVVCYDDKGEIVYTMVFLSGNKMYYKNYYYDAKEEGAILSDFRDLFDN